MLANEKTGIATQKHYPANESVVPQYSITVLQTECKMVPVKLMLACTKWLFRNIMVNFMNLSVF